MVFHFILLLVWKVVATGYITNDLLLDFQKIFFYLKQLFDFPEIYRKQYFLPQLRNNYI
jgi:hypothetical protein